MTATDQNTVRFSGTGPTLALILVVLALIGSLFAIDFFLANLERNELQSQAGQLYEQGSRLLKQGKAADAVEVLRRAHALVRQNRTYQLALVDALLAAGKIEQAGDLLADLLQADPNGGEANLMMAHLLLKENRVTEAIAYYHRAIYGTWSANPDARRLQARLELVKLLEKPGDRKELLAELLPLDGEVSDVDTRRKLGHWYLEAGSPERAAGVYRALLAAGVKTEAVYTGLGEAELAFGDYHAAMSAFVNAYRANPSDPAARKNIELSSAVTALDPTERRIRSSEKFRRSTRILELARDALQRCLAQHGLATSDDEGQADVLLTLKSSTNITNEMAEERLALAEQLWKDRIASCGTAIPPQEEPLLLIMEKLAR
jgi:tetratricopeptide (TPR) repeat protein